MTAGTLVLGAVGEASRAQDQGIEVVVPAPYVWRGGAEALEFRTWKWHPTDDPRLAMPRPEPATGLAPPPLPGPEQAAKAINDLRGWRDPGPVGWMRLTFMVEPAGLGQDTILALKGIAADVDIHINGQRLLQARGAVDRPWERVLEVPVPGKLLRATDNVLALRLEAWPGFPGLGFVGFRGAFAALRPEEPAASARPPAWLPDLSPPPGVPPLEAGTGRLGRAVLAPLMSCRMDADSWTPLAEASKEGWSGRIHAPGQVALDTVFVTMRGATGRILERRASSGKGLWRVYQPLLAPGWVVEALDATVSIEIPEVAGVSRSDAWGAVAQRTGEGRLAQLPGTSPWLLLAGRRTAVPLLLASDQPRVMESGITTRDGTMSVQIAPGEHVRVLWPEGAWPAARGGPEAPDAARLARARFWAGAALPWGMHTVATGHARDGTLNLEDRWNHLPFGTTPVAVLAPALGLRAGGDHGPARVRTDATDLDVTTTEGPLLGRTGDRVAYSVPPPRRQPVRRLPTGGKESDTATGKPPATAGAADLLDAAARDTGALVLLDPTRPLTPQAAPREALARVWRERAWARTPGEDGLRWIQAWLDGSRGLTDAILGTGPVLDRTSRMTDAAGMRLLGASGTLAEVTASILRHQDPASLLMPTGPDGADAFGTGHAVAGWLAMTGSWRLASGRDEPRLKAQAARLGPLAADPEARIRWRRGLGLADATPTPLPLGRAELREGTGWPLAMAPPAAERWLAHPDVSPGLREGTDAEAWMMEAAGLDVLAARHLPGERLLELAVRGRGTDPAARRIVLLLPTGASLLEMAPAEAGVRGSAGLCTIRREGGRRFVILPGSLPEGPLTLRFRYA